MERHRVPSGSRVEETRVLIRFNPIAILPRHVVFATRAGRRRIFAQVERVFEILEDDPARHPRLAFAFLVYVDRRRAIRQFVGLLIVVPLPTLTRLGFLVLVVILIVVAPFAACGSFFFVFIILIAGTSGGLGHSSRLRTAVVKRGSALGSHRGAATRFDRLNAVWRRFGATPGGR